MLGFISSAILFLPVAPQLPGGSWSTWVDVKPTDRYDETGSSLTWCGDVNDDGFPDFAVGSPGEKRATGSGTRYYVGWVRVHSGRNGGVLREWSGLASEDNLGAACARVPDVDGDGHDELLLGIPGYRYSGGITGRFVLVSPRTGFWMGFGSSPGVDDRFATVLCGLPDTDGDGAGDFLIAAPEDAGAGTSSGIVYQYSGATQSLIRAYSGDASRLRCGRSLASLGDVDGDGFGDFAIGYENGWPQSISAVRVHSGLTGAEIYGIPGRLTVNRWNVALCSIADLDGDGVRELAVGWPDANSGGLSANGAVAVHSGRTGALLSEIPGHAPGILFGTNVADAGDLDRDGYPEVAVYLMPSNVVDVVRIHSALGGLLLAELPQPDPGSHYGSYWGSAMASGEDLDLDGIPELLIGAPNSVLYEDPGGLARVLKFDPFLRAEANGLSAQSGGRLRMALDFPSAAAGAPYALLFSSAARASNQAGGVALPLAPSALLSRSLAGSYPSWVHQPRGSLDAEGRAMPYLDVPAGALAGQIGREFSACAVSQPPGQSPLVSAAIVIRVQP